MEFTVNHQKTKFNRQSSNVLFLSTAWKKVMRKHPISLLLFQWLFAGDPYTNLYLLFLRDSFNRSKFVVIFYGLVSFRELMYSIVYKSLEIFAPEMFMQV